MIPEFPQFKKLAVEDAGAIDEFTSRFPTYSDYNFSSLLGWDIDNEREVSTLNGNLVVKFTDYETGEPFLSFLGDTESLLTTEALLQYSESKGMGSTLRLVPEISIHTITSRGLKCIKDEDNYDYLYLTQRMATLEGNQYKSKRKLRNRFLKEYPSHELRICRLSDQQAQDDIRAITQAWRNHREIDNDAQSIEHETQAIENFFRMAAERSIFAGVVYVQNEPTAFTIEEIVNGNTSIGHFWKTTVERPGEYEFLASSMGEYLMGKGVVYWNWEQDLGVQTLRWSKSSYRPSDFLRKFTVSRRLSLSEKILLVCKKTLCRLFTSK